MYKYVCHITVHSFDLFIINDIINMMHKLMQKYGLRFSRIESLDVKTRRKNRPTRKNRRRTKKSPNVRPA